MYILFASDMKDWLTHKGVSLENLQLQFIQYADDIALMAENGEDLELGLKNIAGYLKENQTKKNQVNVIKTKVPYSVFMKSIIQESISVFS